VIAGIASFQASGLGNLLLGGGRGQWPVFIASSSGSGSCLSCFGTFIIIIIIKYQSCLSLAIFVIYELKLCLLGVSRIWA